MITTLAVAGYRSLRDVVLALGPLTVVTGGNGSGKSSLYRALRLLSEVAQGRLIASLAAEGGLSSTLWAGPERIGRDMRDGVHPIQGTRRSGPVTLRLGFAGEDYGYAIDLGLPVPGTPFPHDPEIKVESVWTGQRLSRSNAIAERRGPRVQLRRGTTGEWRSSMDQLSGFDSMMTHCADPDDGLELLLLREKMRSWRFYDHLRTDRDAPARRPQVATYTPVLAGDGSDLAAAIGTIQAVGDWDAFGEVIDDAFPGSEVAFAGDQGNATIAVRQTGLLRPLQPSELSDGTLRYLLLAAALLSPRPPALMILNEPETSLHPSLLAPLARLLIRAAETCQIVVVSHSAPLVEALRARDGTTGIVLEKAFGQTEVADADPPQWHWPTR
ncbi:AAA family ATPase [Allosphingosinicella deserti]|uniref:ATP-binding protein n=1 Tax=Allosphingosinicella deserti TaxID=2116704 RepID=A0A2P7QR98_9SPHN|nr:AAA family ATPase [Sphingomonas deserti]PSJ40492.1 ATP-binding protein [Sphingomonas deserti]